MNQPSFLVPFAAALLAWQAASSAGTRSSASYAVPADSVDAGGRRAGSAAYTNDASVGGVVGVSTATLAPQPQIAKAGYVAQLYEVVGFTVAGASSSLAEGGSLQLFGRQVLDDATFLAVPAASVTWSVGSGPLTGVSTAGVATAGVVYQNTPAVARGIFGGQIGSVSLTVLNTNLDNYGTYAGDGIDDAWQVQYFGLDNPQAGPTVDADGTGQTNLFKYLAGLDPTNPGSRFVLSIAKVAGQPTQKTLTLSPVYSGRTYTVQSTASLTQPNWATLPNATSVENGTTRTVTDPSANTAQRFYRVQISLP